MINAANTATGELSADLHARQLPGTELSKAEQWLRWAVEVPAMLVVVAEVVILFAGITARAVFDHPLVWSDELASILFLWLAMLGMAIAVQRTNHMRLTFFVSLLSPRAQVWAETLAAGAVAIFLLMILHPTLDYLDDQGFVETPALGWSGVVRASAIPVGIGIAFLSCCLRLLRQDWRDLVSVAALIAVVGAALYFAQPALIAMGKWSLLVFFIGFLGLAIMAGIPIAFAFSLATSAYLLTITTTPITIVVGRIDEGMSSLILLAVPLFVTPGPTRRGHRDGAGHGGLPGFAAGPRSGRHVLRAAGRDSACLRDFRLEDGGHGGRRPRPVSRDAQTRDEGRRTGLDPRCIRRHERNHPTLDRADRHRVGYWRVDRRPVHGRHTSRTGSCARAGPRGPLPRRTGRGFRPIARAPFSVVAKTFIVALPAIALPFLIRSAVVEGIATATEVSTIGIAYSLVAGLLIYRGGLNWNAVPQMLVQTASLSGAILFIVGAASAMAWALTQSGFSHDLAASMAAVPGGAAGFLLISIVVFIVLGSVLEGIPAIVLFGPLLFPVARQLGVHEVHYAMVVILAMGLGLFAPPFGLCYYASCIIGNVSPEAGLKKIWIYLGALLVGLLVITFVPWITLGFL